MARVSVPRSGVRSEGESIEELIRLIKRLLRHRAYERTRIVSALLLRHLPHDSGYAWENEARLRERLTGAGLDAKTLDYLITNARLEFERLQERTAG
ncbi:hypothetical protein [Methylobacterium trifolii]|uniref:Uncharacterized protein n=1 Tax=Methylobacterium trifolii TaxID=1003092 RepID=A0ABQ4TT22_9HYPH|nr:hypothetical protein [Methylobacterium trifolii]GJE58468.1 hypothetical protein MPOCJGCO_0549 [Methylobacterium trifolii]